MGLSGAGGGGASAHAHSLTWLQLAARLDAGERRIVLPLGCTEQHAHLSLGTDTIEVERIAVEAAAPLGVPVLPALPYGVTPQLAAFPGSPSLTAATLAALLRELLGSLALQGYEAVLVLNGHLGNAAARPALEEGFPWVGGHASWVESFPWVRIPGVELPAGEKPLVPLGELAPVDPLAAKALLGDGSYGGAYDRGQGAALAVHQAAVAGARAALEALAG